MENNTTNSGRNPNRSILWLLALYPWEFPGCNNELRYVRCCAAG